MNDDTRERLSADEASLVRLSAAIAAGDPHRVAEGLGSAAEAARPEAVEEAILQSYLFVGFPAALNALAIWRRRRPQPAASVEGTPTGTWAARGEAVCRTVYAEAYEALRQGVCRLHPDVEAWMLHEGYGKVLGRPGLPLAARELCIIGLLAAQDAPRQLHSHLRGALNAGVPEDRVEAALEVALTEAGRSGPTDPERRAMAHRSVWADVRDRHRAKRAMSRHDPMKE